MKLLYKCLCLVVFAALLCGCSRGNSSESDTAMGKFVYGDKNISVIISEEDAAVLSEIFQGKLLYSDSLSCGFTENVSVSLDGQTYCIANDNCGIVYIIEKDRYFNIDDEENETLRSLLEEYGFSFPCV